MGLIKSIFGFIGGIFKAIAGLVGIGKKSEFYMELKDADGGSSPAEVTAPAVAQPAVASSTPEKVAPASAPAPTPAPVAKAPVATAAQPAASVPSFAANYLTNAGAALPSRRRPGPSLSPFMDMAKQVKAR